MISRSAPTHPLPAPFIAEASAEVGASAISLRADRSAAAKFSDAFRAQDPDFFGAVLAGYDELSALGADDSTVAPKGGRR